MLEGQRPLTTEHINQSTLNSTKNKSKINWMNYN
jgi:hypothetical protein